MLDHRLVTSTERYFLQRYSAQTLQGAVEKAASEELESGLLDHHYHLPVDIENIARRKRIRICEKELPRSKEANLLPEKGGFVIQIRPNVHGFRRRTTLAHEIGHSLFYSTNNEQPRHKIGLLDKNEVLGEERICIRFARALLMPAQCVKQSFVPSATVSPEHLLAYLERAAKKFEVSWPAFVLRLQDLRVHGPDFIVLCFRLMENQKTGGDPQLRVDLAARFGAARSLYIPTNRSAEGMGLKSVVTLFDDWKNRSARGAGEEWGRFTWRDDDGLRRTSIKEQSSRQETIQVSTFRYGRWRREQIKINVASCLFARKNADESRASIISILTPIGSLEPYFNQSRLAFL